MLPLVLFLPPCLTTCINLLLSFTGETRARPSPSPSLICCSLLSCLFCRLPGERRPDHCRHHLPRRLPAPLQLGQHRPGGHHGAWIQSIGCTTECKTTAGVHAHAALCMMCQRSYRTPPAAAIIAGPQAGGRLLHQGEQSAMKSTRSYILLAVIMQLRWLTGHWAASFHTCCSRPNAPAPYCRADCAAPAAQGRLPLRLPLRRQVC